MARMIMIQAKKKIPLALYFVYNVQVSVEILHWQVQTGLPIHKQDGGF